MSIIEYLERPKFILIACLLCLICLVLTPAPSKAQDIDERNKAQSLILSDTYSEHYLSPYFTIYEDTEGNITPEDIQRGLFIDGKTSTNSGSIVNLNAAGNPVWLSFNVVNRSETLEWKIDFGSASLGRFGMFDSIEAYTSNILTENLKAQKTSPDGTIKLLIPQETRTHILLRLTSKKGLPVTIPVRMLKGNYPAASDHNTTMNLLVCFTIGMIFFFSAIAIMRTQYYYFHFSLYYMSLTILLLTQNIFVTSNYVFLGSSLIPFLFLLTTISSLLIARIFWNVDDKPKSFHVLFTGLILFCTVSFLLGRVLPIPATSIKFLLYYGPSLFTPIIIPLITLIQTQRSSNEIPVFLFSWFILFFGLAITFLSLNGFIPTVSTAVNAFWFTLIPQAFFFVMATKIKFKNDIEAIRYATVEIEESETVSKLRQSKESIEQERLLRVIEQERKVLGELRKSEARRAEEMRIAKEEADRANKAKSAFLAVVTHEIRTPMTGIMGMVRLLRDSNLTKEQHDYAQTIQESSDAMLALLNDILDFEKIEQGKMSLENISFDLHRLINGVATLMKGHAVQKNIELKTKIGENLPKYVYGDPTRLRQVLLNLTGNAVKFTSLGSVAITAELMKENFQEGTCEIYFGVTDTGVGISKAAQKELFSPFAQADNSIARRFGGTGLGLAISKGLVERMKSQININSNEGEGSTFFFTLNMAVGEADIAEKQRASLKNLPPAKSLHIMVVDDNKINQKVIEGFLERTPHTLTSVDDAKTALDLLEKEKFDLILMDIVMPDLSGDEATRIIRNSNNERIRNTPVIALTGNTMPQDIESYYEAGMNGYISKPVDIDFLKSTINKAGQNVFDNPRGKVVKKSMAAPETKENPQSIRTEDQAEQPPSYIEGSADAANGLYLSPDGEQILNTETLETLKKHLKIQDIQAMLNDVVVKNDEIIESMNQALAEDKKADLSARGHEMKGMSGNFGLMELSHHAVQIENKAKTDATIVLTSLLEPLPEMQNRAKMALKAWLEENAD